MSKNATRNAKIVSDFATGNFTKAALARRYNVDEATIRRVLKAEAKPLVKPVAQDTKLKLGDTVVMSEVGKKKHTNTRVNPHDKLGVIISLQYSLLHPISVQWENGVQNCYKEHELQLGEKVNQAVKKSPVKTVKVGDTVKLSLAGISEYIDSEYNPHIGVGKVIHKDRFTYEVQWENGVQNCYADYQLEVVSEPASDIKASVKAKAKKAFEKQQEVAEGSAETGIRAALQAGQQVAFIITGDSIVLTLGGDTEIVDSTHQNYKAIQLAILDGNFREAYDLMNISKAITKFSKGSITVQNGELYYGEMQLKSSLVNRILDLMAQGDEGFKRLVNFLERLLNNPSRDSVEQLWGFVSHLDVEIDEDGFIIGWKKVQNKNGRLFDSYTGKVPNDVGNVVEMPRFMVNANRDQTCSQGLHVGAWDYVKGFSGDTILKVKVDPADVVSVPSDYNDMKMRAAKYTVLDVVDGNKNLKDFTRAADVKVLHVKVGERGEILSSQEI